MTEDEDRDDDESPGTLSGAESAGLAAADFLARGVPVDGKGQPDVRAAPFTVELLEPVEFGKSRYTSLTFGKWKASIMKGVRDDQPGLANVFAVAERITGVPRDALYELGIEDTRLLIAVANAFLRPLLGR